MTNDKQEPADKIVGSTDGLDCVDCNGRGWLAVEVCCKRAWHNCGGHGCTGSEQEQQECSKCGGIGKKSNV